MILRQFLQTDPVAISYLFGCGGQATAAVVDPVGDIFLVPEPAQFGHPQNPAIPIQRGHTSEVESKEAQNFSLIGLRRRVQ